MKDPFIIFSVFSSVFLLCFWLYIIFKKNQPVETVKRKIEYPGVPEPIVPFLRYIARFYEKRLSHDNSYLLKVRKRMKESRTFRALSPTEFLALQTLIGMVFSVIGLIGLIAANIPRLNDPVSTVGFMILMGILGAWTLNMPMDNAILKRQQSILKDWPFFMDLLVISIEAGMGFPMAVRRIIKTLPLSPLTEELLQYENEVNLGKRRVDAIKELGDRINVQAIRSILLMIAQAETLGTSLGPLLRIQTKEFREHKAQMVEKKALEAPVKMLFPLLICIFPAILIVLLGPVFMQYSGVQ